VPPGCEGCMLEKSMPPPCDRENLIAADGYG